MAFDIDFNFSGLEESSLTLGIQIEPDVIENGNYSVKNLVDDEFVINASADCVQRASAITKECMETTVSIATGLIAEPSIAFDFGEGHV